MPFYGPSVFKSLISSSDNIVHGSLDCGGLYDMNYQDQNTFGDSKTCKNGILKSVRKKISRVFLNEQQRNKSILDYKSNNIDEKFSKKFDNIFDISFSEENLSNNLIRKRRCRPKHAVCPFYYNCIQNSDTVSEQLSTDCISNPANSVSDSWAKQTMSEVSVTDDCTTTDSSSGLKPSNEYGHSWAAELKELTKYGWYWGRITKLKAEEILHDQPDGAFLVRDSSDVRYLLSLSFKSFGKTLHTRIEYSNGWFGFYPYPENDGQPSLVNLIEHSVYSSNMGVFCYSRLKMKSSSFPVRLTTPVSRFTHVRSLQYLCRSVIRQNTRLDHIQCLPLPPKLKTYLEESFI